ncbi:MAG TPA: XRE family transcriptional regulator [Anaerolineaceae bacterium]|nr:XRE family transcriptional regulator [Anaerolineaceae bacterium]
MDHQATVQPAMGARIKEKRREEGISIRELARRTGLTASFISQVENGKANVSLESLRKVSTALNVRMLYFLSEVNPQFEMDVEAQPEVVSEKLSNTPKLIERNHPLIKGNMRARLFLPDSGITYELLTSRLDHKMEAFIGRMAPRTGNVAYRLAMPTEEFIYCLSGALKVGIRYEVYTLEAGDSIYFEGINLTLLASGSDSEETVWLSVITPPAF